MHMLIVLQHFGAGVAHQFQLVLIGGLHGLHQCGKSMAAAIRRKLARPARAFCMERQAHGLQSGIEAFFPVFLIIYPLAVWPTEHRAACAV